MRLGWTKNKNSTTYRAVKTIRVDGKNRTLVVKTFGSDKFICETYGVIDAKAWAKEQVRMMDDEEEEEEPSFGITLHSGDDLPMDTQRCFNGGYLFLQQIYYELGLDRICAMIRTRHGLDYNLNSILSRLLYTRILYPSSKLDPYRDSGRFIEQPDFDLHQVCSALSVLAAESDYIQARLFKNSMAIDRRRTEAIYYGCTDFCFEAEKAADDRLPGPSKESPLPTVRIGLFMDQDGIPLAFCINPGNENGQQPLIPLEKKLMGKFGMSRLIVCIDAGLTSNTDKLDQHRQEIEECFRIMKSEIQAQPVYLKRQEFIVAHSITCFLSLTLSRYLEKKLDNRYTAGQIIGTLREMDFIKYEGKGYHPNYTRTELTDALHEAFGFCTSKEIVPIKKMKKICSDTKRQRE